MLTLSLFIIFLFSALHLVWAVQAYQKQTAPWIVLGLWVLGFLNVVAGTGALIADYPMGAAPIVIGIVSIELGVVLLGYWKDENGPNWDVHALRIALEVFIVGLMVTSV